MIPDSLLIKLHLYCFDWAFGGAYAAAFAVIKVGFWFFLALERAHDNGVFWADSRTGAATDAGVKIGFRDVCAPTASFSFFG